MQDVRKRSAAGAGAVPLPLAPTNRPATTRSDMLLPRIAYSVFRKQEQEKRQRLQPITVGMGNLDYYELHVFVSLRFHFLSLFHRR